MSNPRKDYKLYLFDILESCKKIISYTKGKTEREFANDKKTIDAVIRNIEIIGEAASKIPKKEREKIQQIPWKEVVAMRNKVVHEYFDVNVPIVWETIQADIPTLKKNIQNALKNTRSK